MTVFRAIRTYDPIDRGIHIHRVLLLSGAVPIASCATKGDAVMKEHYFIDLSKGEKESPWETVDDVVMGGLSKSSFSHSGEGTEVFQGTVSLDNYGGFASVRSAPGEYAL